MAKSIGTVLTWLFIADGLIAYNLGWYGVLAKRVFWSVPNEFWFYDAAVSGIFGIFFLLCSTRKNTKEQAYQAGRMSARGG